MFEMEEIRPKNIPKYDELSVKNIFPHLKADPEVMAYFPNQMAQNRWPDRTYMFTILNTLKPDYVQNIVLHASKMRNSAQGKNEEGATVSVTDAWWKKLHEIPFVSSKCSSMINFLQLARVELFIY